MALSHAIAMLCPHCHSCVLCCRMLTFTTPQLQQIVKERLDAEDSTHYHEFRQVRYCWAWQRRCPGLYTPIFGTYKSRPPSEEPLPPECAPTLIKL